MSRAIVDAQLVVTLLASSSEKLFSAFLLQAMQMQNGNPGIAAVKQTGAAVGDD